MWASVNRLLGVSRSQGGASAVLRPDGSLAVNEEDKCEAWADYYERLGRPKQDPNFDSTFAEETKSLVAAFAEESKQSPNENLDKDFDDEELEVALDNLQFYKACSFDQVRNEALKVGGEEIRTELLKLFNWINAQEQVPTEWAKSLVFCLYKDGEETDPGNYRGISLISCLGKLYLSIWTQRLTEHLDPQLAEEQGGFRAHRSTVDQIFTLNETLLRRRRDGKKTFCFFVDFRKAFDTVWHDGLWRRLWESGVKSLPWRILRSLYSGLQASVLVDGAISRSAAIGQGVRQGCPLSPILFSCYINDLVRRLKGLGGELSVGDRRLCSLLYADDIVLLADSAEHLQRMIDEVSSFCAQWRLDLNTSKSQVMVVHPDSHREADPTGWFWRGERLKEVAEYKYLGVVITNKLLWKRHISKVVDKGKSALQPLRRLFAQKLVPLRIKRLVYTARVRSKLEYASQIWSTDKADAKALESIQHQALALMLKTNRNASVTALRTITGLPTMQGRRNMMRLFYMGVLLSKDKQTWPRHCVEEPVSVSSKVVGKSQKHWITYFRELLKRSVKLKSAYQRMLDHLGNCDDVLRNYQTEQEPPVLIRPVPSWRQAVREFVKEQDLAHFRSDAQFMSTLAVLDACTDACLSDRHPLVNRGFSPINLIRLRLLAGTSSLNSTMSKVSGSSRSNLCPICLQSEETTVHFLRECTHEEAVKFRRQHLESMPECFSALSNVAQTAFVLGGSVESPTNASPLEPSKNQDMHNEVLVGQLWDLRKEALDRDLEIEEPLDLTIQQSSTDSSSIRSSDSSSSNAGILRYFPQSVRPVQGVEAHGVITKPSS